MLGAVLRSWAVATVSSLRPTLAPCSDGGDAYVSRPAARQRRIVRESASAVSYARTIATPATGECGRYSSKPRSASPSAGPAGCRGYRVSVSSQSARSVRSLSIRARIAWRSSSVAEQGTHKPLAGGSNPPSATKPSPLEELAAALARGTDALGVQDDAHVVLAVSGGPDSMALFHGAAHLVGTDERHWRLVVAHLDHGL